MVAEAPIHDRLRKVLVVTATARWGPVVHMPSADPPFVVHLVLGFLVNLTHRNWSSVLMAIRRLHRKSNNATICFDERNNYTVDRTTDNKYNIYSAVVYASKHEKGTVREFRKRWDTVAGKK